MFCAISFSIKNADGRRTRQKKNPVRFRRGCRCANALSLACFITLHPAYWDAGRTRNDMDVMFAHGSDIARSGRLVKVLKQCKDLSAGDGLSIEIFQRI
ncbi:hypothetical protein ASE32_15045 [Ensifer sp. Root231]|nr:hypothetical protein ASE32_15045 [Ensifer sp. Root231]OMQ37821.1 hypothetical protein BKP54_31730 [Ensifer sp. 1H6]